MANKKVIKQWFTYAGRDLRVAKALQDLGPDYKTHVAFNAQQCVEKALKGYLVFLGHRPPKTHSIKDLLDMISKHDPILTKKLSKTKKLTQYAVGSRYPDAQKKSLTLREADWTVKTARFSYEELLERVLTNQTFSNNP